MCYQLIELYAACRCLYYQHAVDHCASYGSPGHRIAQRTIFVGYECTRHSDDNNLKLGRGSNRLKPRSSTDKPRLVQRSIQDSNTQEAYDDGDDFNQLISSETDSLFFENSQGSTSMESITNIDESQVLSLSNALFQDMLHHPVLCYLWPQILRLSTTRFSAKLSIERLIRRYAVDLRRVAITELERNSSRLVQWARRDIAQRLTEAHIMENSTEQSIEELRSAGYGSWQQLEKEEEVELVDNEARQLDAALKYGHAKSFLFEGETFEVFLSNVKNFVRLRNPRPARSWTYDIGLKYVSQQISSFVGHFLEPPPDISRTRLRWSCVSISPTPFW